MFRNTYQQGFVSLFNIVGSNPLAIWHTTTAQDGTCRRLTDEDINSMSLDLCSTNSATTYISTPSHSKDSLAIKLPFFIVLLKNMNKYFSFEIQVLDDNNCMRRLRFANFQSKTRVNNFGAQMPLALQPGWNVVQINLADFTRRAYGTNYIETMRVQVNANVRLRRIYFMDRLYEEWDKPDEYQLPVSHLRNGRMERQCKATTAASAVTASATTVTKGDAAPPAAPLPSPNPSETLNMSKPIVT